MIYAADFSNDMCLLQNKQCNIKIYPDCNGFACHDTTPKQGCEHYAIATSRVMYTAANSAFKADCFPAG